MKILLVDDHGIIRDGLRAILSREADMVVVGEATSGDDAVAKTRALAPDLVVMDVSMPGVGGIEATRKVLDARPATRVIGLSMHADRRSVHAMFEAGAQGYVLKNAAADELLQAIRAVSARRTYVSSAIVNLAVGGFVGEATPRGAGAPQDLSARERELLKHLAEGKTSKEAASQMDIAVSTVETYRRQLMAKLDIHTVAELTKYAIRHGLTSVD